MLNVEFALAGVFAIKDFLKDMGGGELNDREQDRFYKNIRRVRRDDNIEVLYESFLGEFAAYK